MISIISEKGDLTTDLVIEWLNFYGVNFKRFNDDEAVSIDELNVALDKTKKMWQRRGTFFLIPKELFQNYDYNVCYIHYLGAEVNTVSTYFERKFKSKLNSCHIGSYVSEKQSNKLLNLDSAKKVGLEIPETLVVNCKKELVAFVKKNGKCISKDLFKPVLISKGKKQIVSTGVKIIKKDELDSLKDCFVPMLIQKYVPKQFELRIFFFQENLYPMAIFSQSDNKTKIDFRNYNKEKPNRCVPFILPEDIKEKILLFIQEDESNTGSIDLIITPNGEYIFLEVNPMGQFHWLSLNCNYHIEKDIADFLAN